MGALTLSIYDELNRPRKSWVRNNTDGTVTLRNVSIYGDSASLSSPEDNNLKGKLYKHYDEAGLTTIATYDFKGQVPEKIRQVIKDSELLGVFSGPPTDWVVTPYTVDWSVYDDTTLETQADIGSITILDTQEYTTSMEYDGLGRVTRMTYPEDLDSQRKVLLPSYNRSSALERVKLKNNVSEDDADAIVYVDRIAYNARGQKILTALGNGTMTRYLYRNDNFRLLRMKSESYEKTTDDDTVTYAKQSGTIKQNFNYEYDLSGNIISITDTTTGCGVAGTDSLEKEFEYDALYRLLSATGRETASTGTTPWTDRYRPHDNTVSRAYTQSYDYDKLGNIQTLQHIATGGNFTRTFGYISGKNKLDNIVVGSNTYDFTHDVNGNIIQEDTNRHFSYDYADRLNAFYIQSSTEEPSIYTQYFYDAGGNRVKKITRTQDGGTRTTVYIDGIFEHLTESGSSTAIPNLMIGVWTIGDYGGDGEQNVLHIMDGSSRVATRRLGYDFGDSTPSIKYNLEDHLGSSTLQLGTDSSLISSEEYYPFGETSFGSYGKKRYRFCGKEKDLESGLYYYGLRYYNPWTCRFISIDPLAGETPGLSPYCYANCNPIMMNDPTGGKAEGGGKDVSGDGKTDLHQTASGDTYGSLAKKYGVSVDQLRAWNGYGDKDIPTGQNLIVSQEGYDMVAGQMSDYLNKSLPTHLQHLAKGPYTPAYKGPEEIKGDNTVVVHDGDPTHMVKPVDVLSMVFSPGELDNAKGRYAGEVQAGTKSAFSQAGSPLRMQTFLHAHEDFLGPALINAYAGALMEFALVGRAGYSAYKAAGTSSNAARTAIRGANDPAASATGGWRAIHGNSIDSPRPTWGYKLYSLDGKTFLKNGITSEVIAERRYTRSYMRDKIMKEKILFPNRRAAYEWELQQNKILRGPLNKNMH